MHRRWFIPLGVALVGAGLFGVAQKVGAAPAATVVTYTRTLAGTDFQSLDLRVYPQFITATGGGVYPLWHDPNSVVTPDNSYFEAKIDMPVGAALTSITYYYKDCGAHVGTTTTAQVAYYSGFYTPSTAGFQYVRPDGNGGFGDCSKRYAFTRTGNPLATIVANRRYTIGAHIIGNFALQTEPPEQANPTWYLAGATIRYTCSGSCL
jgi:hypothetical protein